MSRYYARIEYLRRRADGSGIVLESAEIRILESAEIRILRRHRRPSGMDRGIFTSFDGPDIAIITPPPRHRLICSFRSSITTSGNGRPRTLSDYSFSPGAPNSVSTSREFADGHLIMNTSESNFRPYPRPLPHHRVVTVPNEYTPSDISTTRHHHHRQSQSQSQRQRPSSELETREQADLGSSSEETIPSCLNLTAHVSSENQEAQICVICPVEYENNELIGALSCNHCFHVNCITRWLKERNMCPLCRATAIPRGS